MSKSEGNVAGADAQWIELWMNAIHAKQGSIEWRMWLTYEIEQLVLCGDLLLHISR